MTLAVDRKSAHTNGTLTMSLLIISGLPFHLPHHTPETVKPRAHNAMYQVLPDQICLNWPALSTYELNPKDNNPRVEQAPKVEAAGPYVERDAPHYQNFEQNSYASGTLTGLCPGMTVSKVAEGSG